MTTLLLIFSFLSLHAVPQKSVKDFEGTLTFIKQTHFDTTFITYHIKGAHVRIEEKNLAKEITEIFIVNIRYKAIVALHPDNKLFVPLKVRPFRYKATNDIEIIQTKNRRLIQGIICIQWRVRNQKENTEISFWVANEEFGFFRNLIEIVNDIDKINFYFMQLPSAEGFMPFLTEESNLLMEKRTHIELISIERKKLNSNLFSIPSDYSIFRP